MAIKIEIKPAVKNATEGGGSPSHNRPDKRKFTSPRLGPVYFTLFGYGIRGIPRRRGPWTRIKFASVSKLSCDIWNGGPKIASVREFLVRAQKFMGAGRKRINDNEKNGQLEINIKSNRVAKTTRNFYYQNKHFKKLVTSLGIELGTSAPVRGTSNSQPSWKCNYLQIRSNLYDLYRYSWAPLGATFQR